MLLVKTKIGPSTIEGTGLFADEFIPKDTPYWEFAPDFDQTLTKEEVNYTARDIQPGEELTVDYRKFGDPIDFEVK